MNSGLGIADPKASMTRCAACHMSAAVGLALSVTISAHRDDLFADPVGGDHTQLERSPFDSSGHGVVAEYV